MTENSGAAPPRRSFHRAPEAQRRRALIRATLDCIAEQGMQSATVREIAKRAGVTNGLIRHHFSSKNEILYAAYASVVSDMLDRARDASAGKGLSSRERLHSFIEASLAAPVLDPRVFSIWAAFVSLVRVDARIAEIHREGYVAFRHRLEDLLGKIFREEGRDLPAEQTRDLAFKINAIVDGLWIEGCLAEGSIDHAAWRRLGLEAVDRLIGSPLDGARAEQ